MIVVIVVFRRLIGVQYCCCHCRCIHVVREVKGRGREKMNGFSFSCSISRFPAAPTSRKLPRVVNGERRSVVSSPDRKINGVYEKPRIVVVVVVVVIIDHSQEVHAGVVGEGMPNEFQG